MDTSWLQCFKIDEFVLLSHIDTSLCVREVYLYMRLLSQLRHASVHMQHGKKYPFDKVESRMMRPVPLTNVVSFDAMY